MKTDPKSVVVRYIEAARGGTIVSVREYTDTQHAAQVLFPR
jgi:hypothetical protein